MSVELTPEAFDALLRNKEFVSRMRLFTGVLKLMGDCFGERELTIAEFAAFQHHLDELRKWWESAKESAE